MKPELIERLVGKDVKDISYWEEKYPQREAGKIVTRFAPSPTGFMHIGGVYTSLLDYKLAKQNDGVFILRIEDTDGKRYVEGAVDLVISSLKEFGIIADEGPIDEKGNEIGSYGPYVQSQRREIYLSGVKYLLEKGLAYPCFATEEELEAVRKEQTILKLRPGYYGKWAKYRNLKDEQIEQKLDEGKPFIFRFKSNGNWDKKRFFEDAFRGKIQMPENDMDVVLLKSDGLPTYHFAHIIDDHFMRTTHVIRTDEWLASLPLHVQMFESIGWEVPNYVHGAPVQKLDEGNKRKLSKRKDPEANVAYYLEQGYPVEAVKEYLMNLLNSNFEDYKKANPENALETFVLQLKNLNVAGPLLDMKKLENISKEYLATLSSAQLFERTLTWAETYDQDFAKKLNDYKNYIISILAIERDGAQKVRKDYYVFSKIGEEISYFFAEGYKPNLVDMPLSKDLSKTILEQYIASYDHNHSKEEWFENIKKIAADNGFAKNPKEKDKNPDLYVGKGTVSDVATTLRLAITGRSQSPDLYAIMQVLGEQESRQRLNTALEGLE